jgi:hypothetical protein
MVGFVQFQVTSLKLFRLLLQNLSMWYSALCLDAGPKAQDFIIMQYPITGAGPEPGVMFLIPTALDFGLSHTLHLKDMTEVA